MSNKDSGHYYKEGRNFFVNDPEDGIWFYVSQEERDKHAATAIAAYSDPVDGWNEDVQHVTVGEVTGSAQQVDVTRPVGEIDEEEYDEAGDYWPSEFEYRCNYAIKPLSPKKEDV